MGQAMRLTAKKICKAIKCKFGMDVGLFYDTGYGYYHFFSDDQPTMDILMHWPTTSVLVFRMNHLTMEQWLDTFEQLAKEGEYEFPCPDQNELEICRA